MCFVTTVVSDCNMGSVLVPYGGLNLNDSYETVR